MFEFAMIILGGILVLAGYLAVGASVARLNAARHWREAHLKYDDNENYSPRQRQNGIKEYIEDKRAKCLIFWLPLGIWYPIKGLFILSCLGYLNLSQGKAPALESLHKAKQAQISEWSAKESGIESRIRENERKVAVLIRREQAPTRPVLKRTEDGIDYYTDVPVFAAHVQVDEDDTIEKLQAHNVALREELIKIKEILAGLRAELNDLTRPKGKAA